MNSLDKKAKILIEEINDNMIVPDGYFSNEEFSDDDQEN